MKRGAEKQISKDDFSDNEGQEEEHPQIGFKKADESILTTRKIRGLPKRASVAAIPPPPPEDSTKRFGGFSGFGSSSSLPAFSSTTTTNPPPNFLPLSTRATNTAKSLTSFLSSTPNAFAPSTTSSTSPSPFSTAPAAPPAFSQPSKPTQNGSISDPTELKYLTSLRGLNESFRDAVSKAINDDAFADMSVFLERYKSLRNDIQKDFDGKTTQPALFPKSSQNPPAPAPAPVTKAPSMPAPPSGGFTFGGSKVSSTSDTKTTTNGGGFTPSFSVPSTGFVFGNSAESKQKSKPSIGFFGASSDSSKKSDMGSSSFSSPFGTNPSQERTTPSVFGTKAEEKKETSSLSTSHMLFGSGSTASNSSGSFNFGFKSALSAPSGDKDKADEKPSSLFSFGSSATTSPASSFTFGNNASAAPASTTTSSDTPPSRFAGFAGFSKPATTSSGFGFGGPPPSTSSTTFSALAPTPITGSGADTGTSGDAAGDEVPKKSAAESFALNADNKHDLEGAGEEDEETRHAIKLKAYVMKDNNGAKNWVEMGYGVLRIKKHKETETRRVLLRSSSTGQILINFTFHSAFKPAHKGKNVTFVGHDAEQNTKMYTLKLQTEGQAMQLKEALDKEIQAKEGS